MKIKNKGKVHPSPSSSSSSSSSFSSSSDGDFLDVLNYLPAAILALISVLAVEDREALAFMMRRSMETSLPPSPESEKKAPKKSSKKSGAARASGGGACVHAPPAFNYTCFDCYSRYWLRWDSSPHGKLINQAIEAFDEQLASGENSGKNAKGKKKERIGRRSPGATPPELPPSVTEDDSLAPIPPSNDVAPATSGDVEQAETAEDETATLIIPSPPPSNHKGLAGKVWPDVLGLFNSRLWSLWGPN